MNTLLLRLSGPMQSWGVQSRFGVRDTGLEPSKSGVLELVCAALGIDREDDHSLTPLANLRFGVRVDRDGLLKSDYHTANNVIRAGGGVKDTELSTRYYLADALFLVGLASDDLTLLDRVHNALRNPVWPLFLGRKAFVPGEPTWLEDGLRIGQDLEEALAKYRLLNERVALENLRLVLEDPAGTIVRSDQPISFSTGNRRFASRRISIHFISPDLEVV